MMYDVIMSTICDGILNEIHPLALATDSLTNEVFHFQKIMKLPDRDEFKAMEKEVNDHHEKEH